NSNTSLPVTATAQGGVITVTAKTAASPTGAMAGTGVPVGQFTLVQSAVAGQTPAHIGLTFGKTPETIGTLTDISTALVGTGTAVSAAAHSAGSPAAISFTVDYGFGPQQITLNLGRYRKPGGLTQYAGKEINVTQLVQNGAPRGQFKDVVFGDHGTVMVNYDNGRSKMIAKVPIITFNNPNALHRETGGVFQEGEGAGKPNVNDPETNGAGAIVASSVEASNVDIASEFTKMIVTQRGYSANAKVLTASDEMLQEVLGLKR
ncbi:flagellar hook-basal body complex protein, partial [Azospirillum sp. TSH100]